MLYEYFLFIYNTFLIKKLINYKINLGINFKVYLCINILGKSGANWININILLSLNDNDITIKVKTLV